jgi:glycine cleavage system aminomethyltransferase T
VIYVGELGWGLYCPAEFGLRLWDTLWQGGADHGLVAGGYRAIDSFRLEKGYRVWGDLTPEVTPYEAGLGLAVKPVKGQFMGREAVASKASAPHETSLACLVLDDPRSVALDEEPVRADGSICGRGPSGGYGYTVDRSTAYPYVPPDVAAPGSCVEVEIFGRWVPGEVVAEPLFDPRGERVRS